MKNYETFTYKIPVNYAAALINSDFSGLDDPECEELDIFVLTVKKTHGHVNFSYSTENNNESFSLYNDVNRFPANCIELELLVELPYTKIEGIIENEMKIEISKTPCLHSIRDSFDSDIMTQEEVNQHYFNAESNTWYWCDVEVKAIWENIEISEYMGECSYKSEKDFIENSGSYSDMVKTVKAEMKSRLENLKEKLS